MKKLLFSILLILGTFTITFSQDVEINILSDPYPVLINSTNGTILVDINNRSGITGQYVPNYKIRPQIGLPAGFEVTTVDLPSGWAEIYRSSDNRVVMFTNGTDGTGFLPNISRRVTVHYKAPANATNPLLVNGTIFWGDGQAPGTGSGPQTVNNVTGNDNSQTSVKAVTSLPVVFGNINATLTNGLLKVNWTTVTEKNNDRFVIEVSKDGKLFTAIDSVKTLALNGNSDLQLKYSFEKNLGSIAIMGIGINIYGIILVGMILLIGISLLVGRSKISRKYVSLLVIGMLGAGLVFIASCKKEDQQIKSSSKTGKIFVRISQVSDDEAVIYSKVIQATNE